MRTTGAATAVGWLALAALVSGCGGDDEGKKAAQAARPPAKVVVKAVSVETVPIVRDFVARSEARDTIVVQARVEAILESKHFDEGRPVERDQILYELDKSQYQAEVESAQAVLAQAEADLKLANEQVSVRAAEAAVARAMAALKKAQQDVARLRPLAEQDAVPRQDLDTALAAEEVAEADVQAADADLKNAKITEEVGKLLAQANVKKAQAALDLAELDLGYCTIKSPLAGLIGRTQVSVGNLVGRGQATDLAEVSLIDPMWATFSISESEYLGIVRRHGGSEENSRDKVKVSLILADDSAYEHKGSIVVADRAVDVETGTLQLVCEFPNPDGKLRPGQFGRARMAVDTIENAILVPQKAIVERQGVKSVMVVGEGNKVALKTVQIGERHEGQFVISEGLEPSDRVIVEGLQKAQPGAVVEPVDAALSQEAPAKAGDGSGAKDSGDESEDE
jgi:membrane fusion protein (multidrug efflux system)